MSRDAGVSGASRGRVWVRRARPARPTGRALTTGEWLARRWRGVWTSSGVLALAGLAVGCFLLLHPWSFRDSHGATASCAAVVSGARIDTVWKLDIPPETATAFCNQERSMHTKEAVGALVFGATALGLALWAHRQGVRAREGTFPES